MEIKMEEVWKPVKGYEKYYEVSNIGNVRSLDRVLRSVTLFGDNKYCIKKGRILKPRTSKSRGLVTGYYRVMLKGKNKCIHKLVAESFIPNPENKPQVDHIDGDISNNCVANLRWVTQRENNGNPLTLEKKRRKVLCVTLNKVFDSVTQAIKQTNTTSKTLYDSANTNTKKGKYLWKWI